MSDEVRREAFEIGVLLVNAVHRGTNGRRVSALLTKGERIRFDNNDYCSLVDSNAWCSLPSGNTHSDRGDYCVFASSWRKPRARGLP